MASFFGALAKSSTRLLVQVELAILAFAAVLFFTFWAAAETCEITKKSIEETGARNFVVRTADKEILVLGSFLASVEQREAVYKMMNDRMENPEAASSYADMLQKLPDVFKADKEPLMHLTSNVMYVSDLLMDSSYKYVYVYLSDDRFRTLENNATLFKKAFDDVSSQWDWRQVREIQALEKYVIATVGVAAYIHVNKSGVFKDVTYANLETINPLLKASDEVSPADAALKELTASFKDRAANRNLRELSKLLKNGGYKKYSDATIKKDILERFSKAARPKVEVWVDLALKERAQVIAQNPTGEMPKSQLVETLLNKDGKGVVFVPRDNFSDVLSAFKEVCARGSSVMASRK